MRRPPSLFPHPAARTLPGSPFLLRSTLEETFLWNPTKPRKRPADTDIRGFPMNGPSQITLQWSPQLTRPTYIPYAHGVSNCFFCAPLLNMCADKGPQDDAKWDPMTTLNSRPEEQPAHTGWIRSEALGELSSRRWNWRNIHCVWSHWEIYITLGLN